jgi:hypothetical protein
MIFGVIVLFAAFVVARFLLLRDNVKSTTANIVGGAIAIAFLVGSLSHPFGFPGQGATTVADVPTDVPTADVTPVEALPPHDVSANCEALRSNLTKKAANGVFDYVASLPSGAHLADRAAISHSTEYAAFGWAVDENLKEPALAACIAVDGAVLSRAIATYGILRTDVAQSLNQPALAQSGFRIDIRANTLPLGRHTLAVWIWSHDGTHAAIKNTWNVDVH